MGVVGLIGILFFLAGAHLLWQARREVLYWMQEFFRILRGELTRRGGIRHAEAPVLFRDAGAAAGLSRRRNTALLVAGGFALMVLGQVLFLLDLAL